MTNNTDHIFRADFNEMIDCEIIMFSQSDQKRNIHSTVITITEGMSVLLMEEDFDQSGNPDNVIAAGTVTRNYNSDFSAHVKWCCKINADGIRHESDLKKIKPHNNFMTRLRPGIHEAT